MKKGCFRGFIVLMLLAVVIVGFGPKLLEFGLKEYYPQKYTEIVEENAEKNQLDANLVYAVIHTESKFKENAESGAGACGLMQLTPETYEWVLTHDAVNIPEGGSVWEPENNIEAGTSLLRFLWNHYGSLDVALSAYNAGMGNVTKWLEDKKYSGDGKTLDSIPFPETEKYVEKVRFTYRIYQRLYGEQ